MFFSLEVCRLLESCVIINGIYSNNLCLLIYTLILSTLAFTTFNSTIACRIAHMQLEEIAQGVYMSRYNVLKDKLDYVITHRQCQQKIIRSHDPYQSAPPHKQHPD